MPNLRIAGVEPESIVDGPGVRYVIFTQGCSHHCKGCHNQQTWDYRGGYEVDPEDLFKDILSKELLSGVTFSGGEPFDQVPGLLFMAKALHDRGINLWCYTGYTWDKIRKNIMTPFIDVIVDGPYVEEQRDLSLRYRGSRNQMIIDNLKSLKMGAPVWYMEK